MDGMGIPTMTDKNNPTVPYREIPIYFRWISITPDTRAYKPSSPKFVPVPMYEETPMEDATPLYVVVVVPLIVDYFYNFEELLEELVEKEKGDEKDKVYPILTHIGMKYIRDILEAEVEIENEEFDKELEDWE